MNRLKEWIVRNYGWEAKRESWFVLGFCLILVVAVLAIFAAAA